MTIEEKARNHAGYDVMPTPDIVTEIRMANIRDDFKAGAEWMLEKAIDWLQYHVNDYLFDDGTPERPWLKCSACMFDAFKKAMDK